MNKKEEFRAWLVEHIGQDLFTMQIVDAACNIFDPPSFSQRIQIQDEDPGFKRVVEEIDVKPLNKDAKKVFNFMCSHEGGWFTPEEITEKTGVTERSVTSHIRNFRIPKWGKHLVPKRRSPRFSSRRVWEYTMQANKDSFTYRNFTL